MSKWLIKTGVQRIISWLPASHVWNRLFQEHVTRTLAYPPERFKKELSNCRTHLESFLELQPSKPENFTVMEIGTGWYPVVPLGLYLCGAAEVWTFDIAPLVSRSGLKRVLGRLVEFEQNGSLRQLLPQLRPERLERVRQAIADLDRETPSAWFERFQVHLMVQTAAQTGLAPGKIDLFASTVVLQHIPQQELSAIFAECRRVAAPGAVASHYITMADQFSYFDNSITPFNFLKYSGRQWKYLNSPIIPANRLRYPQYREMLAANGFEVVTAKNTLGAQTDLDKVPLAPQFKSFKQGDLLVIWSWLVARFLTPTRSTTNGQ